MMSRIQVIIDTMSLQMKQSFARSMFRFCLIANPIVNTILIYYMFQNSGEENFAAFVVMGAGLMGLWSSICFSSAGDINRERFNGTLSVIYTAPSDFRLILWGKILGNTILALSTLLISFFTAKILFRAVVVFYHPFMFLLAMTAVVWSFLIISVVIGYLLMLSRKTTLYMNCIEIPIILLCGFVFPITMLPAWVQYISICLTPTWAVKLIRLSLEKELAYKEYITSFLILIVMNVLYLAAVKLLYRRIDKKIRIQGTLEVS